MRVVKKVPFIRMAALISAEIGGAKSMEPVITAAQGGLPVIDGDGMGRAFPEVQMTTFFIYGPSRHRRPLRMKRAMSSSSAMCRTCALGRFYCESYAQPTPIG